MHASNDHANTRRRSIFQPVEEDFDWHQGERDPQDDSLAGGD
jgi:hypothetical protein